jgi:hypothetical protein
VAQGQVRLAWHGRGGARGQAAVRVLRALNAAPQGPADPAAALVYAGTAEAAADPVSQLLPTTRNTARSYTYTVYACDSHGTCAGTGSSATVALTLAQVLPAGGYVLYFRHAAADVCVDRTDLGPAERTQVPGWWKSCDAVCATATARQLSSAGVAQARALGQDLKRYGVPFGQVVASEFCRAIQTAQGMALGPAIETSPDLTYFVYGESSRCERCQALLARPPRPGTNTALISHSGDHCPVLDSLAPGEAAIYKPDGHGRSIFIERVAPGTW